MTDIDKYIGRRIRNYRERQGYALADFADCLSISEKEFLECEAGLRKIHASELFDLKREYNVPLRDFFTNRGEYLADVINENSEIADLLHYFDHIVCHRVRQKLLGQIKEASSVF